MTTLPKSQHPYNECYENSNIENPILKASYNSWELNSTRENVKGDKILWWDINDNVYRGPFRLNDTIHYNQSQPTLSYRLIDTDFPGWLTFNNKDGNNNGIASASELNYRFDNSFFEHKTSLDFPIITQIILFIVLYLLYISRRPPLS